MFYWDVTIHHAFYPTLRCENQWFGAKVSKAVDSTGLNLRIGYNTLMCISVARGVYMFMAFMPYLATSDLFWCQTRMVCSVYIFLLITILFTDWITLFVASNSLDKIAKCEIIKRLFCHAIHGNMTSQLEITWQRGKTIAKLLFTCVSTFANSMADNQIRELI